MDFGVLVRSLIEVLIVFRYDVTCTQINLNIHLPVNMINVSIPISDSCILFVQAAVIYLFF